ncbi:ABC transporter ATP-binding protein [Desulfogranum mediterraneum]|uniref:ABC transporter ATP-binding protein n=1 Tax=Desulfogranum mediterraneum TaxID=160661 RepID=UPI000400B5AA|nr:ABC transporter ATP-binding protein [Desulfogranum mediterraneum]
MSNYAIAVRDVSKKYYLYRRPIHRVLEALSPFKKKYHTSFAALKNVGFEVGQGESVGIIGRNGSGKSTLLQLICGNLQPTEGTVDVRGRISALLELGSGFNPEFTGRENVYLNTAILGMSRLETERRFPQIEDFADIGDFIDRPVKTYSSGMYVRLAFATAISVDPEILIIDEALAVGDIFFQQKCVDHMKKVMQSCSILLVSHDMHSITNLCNRVVVLDEGRVVYTGNPVEGVAKYTKLIHNEQASGNRRLTQQRPLSPRVADLAASLCDDFESWLAVSEDDRGGAGEVKIVRVAVMKGQLPAKTVQQGDRVVVRLLVEAIEDKKDLIFGYTVKDRIGNAVFGENSLCLQEEGQTLDRGYSIVEYSFVWPEVYPDSYTLTLGVGEGTHPLTHRIQCWAHNIVSLAAVTPGVAVHGMFNNKLDHLEVSPMRTVE